MCTAVSTRHEHSVVANLQHIGITDLWRLRNLISLTESEPETEDSELFRSRERALYRKFRTLRLFDLSVDQDTLVRKTLTPGGAVPGCKDSVSVQKHFRVGSRDTPKLSANVDYNCIEWFNTESN